MSSRQESPGQELNNLFGPFGRLCFHDCTGVNAFLIADRQVATRKRGKTHNSYVFTNRPISVEETVTIRVLSTQDSTTSGLTFGMTVCDPSGIDNFNLPDDADLLMDRNEYWVVKKKVLRTQCEKENDKLDFHLSSTGDISLSRNGEAPTHVFCVDITVPMWAFWDMRGELRQIKIETKNQNYPASTDNIILTQSTEVILSTTQADTYSRSTDSSPYSSPQLATRSAALAPVRHQTPAAEQLVGTQPIPHRPPPPAPPVGFSLAAVTPPRQQTTVADHQVAAPLTTHGPSTPVGISPSGLAQTRQQAIAVTDEPAIEVLPHRPAPPAPPAGINPAVPAPLRHPVSTVDQPAVTATSQRPGPPPGISPVAGSVAAAAAALARTKFGESLGQTSPAGKRRGPPIPPKKPSRINERTPPVGVDEDILKTQNEMVVGTDAAMATGTMLFSAAPVDNNALPSGGASNVAQKTHSNEGLVLPDRECVICLDKRPDCALYKCGHSCMCFECATELKAEKGSAAICPICREPIQDIIKVYLS